MTPTPSAVLVFAATDPTGGAGLQADNLALASLGCHALNVVTAITVQDTSGVEDVQALDFELIADQARCILEDVPVAAFKLGVLGSVENIATIAEILSDYPNVPVILDPVVASGRGDELASEDMLAALCDLLLPQTTVLTPNTLELRRLAMSETDEDDISNSLLASRLVDWGAEYVLVTGTHDNTSNVINTLYATAGVVRSDHWTRLPGGYHGSGCTLAAAIAAHMANGAAVADAVREAQDYTWRTLEAAYRSGMGQLIPDRLFWSRGRAS